MISLSIDRTSLSLAPLVITDSPTSSGLYFPEDGVTWPLFDTRRETIASKWVAGRTLLSAVREASELPVTVYAHAATTPALEAAKAELETALAQWSYDLTLTVDAVARTYRAEILLGVPWGRIDSGMVRAHLASASFSIPLNP